MQQNVKPSNANRLSTYWLCVAAAVLLGGAVIYFMRGEPVADIAAALALGVCGPYALAISLMGVPNQWLEDLRFRRSIAARFAGWPMQNPPAVFTVLYLSLAVAVGIRHDWSLETWLTIPVVVGAGLAIGQGCVLMFESGYERRKLESGLLTQIAWMVGVALMILLIVVHQL
ncbi:hypothetical protein [Novosphingobium sp. 9U]|uniref:hypothetical protein n=1 Tax=Novosphingobium sp. 9U TaxID=2653158 RepID=UPI0012F4374C|nr:hypothetical protein [Novosphingobium sp. 9U]VWX51071.1 membrane hypothetical protein [Novosphingobium sp. 9U]